MKGKLTRLASVAVIITGLLSGCADSQTPSSSEAASTTAAPQSSSSEQSAEPAEPVTITLWHSMSDEAGVLMDELVQEFNNGIGAEKKITVEAIFQGAYSDSTSKLRTILQNDQKDELPDVMQIDATGIVDYLSTDYKYTVDDALASDPDYDLSQLLEVPLKTWNYYDMQLGLPFASSTTVMFYNKTMLDAAGVTQAPTTFQEIIDLAAKLPAKSADGADLYAYAQVPNTPTLANWIGQMKGTSANASYALDMLNGHQGNPTKLICDSEGTLATFLTEWKKMYDQGALYNQSSGLGDIFVAEQLALYTGSSSNLSTLLTMIGDKFELGCAYFPRVNADANFGATVSGSGMFMFNKGDEAKTGAAWEFVKFLASADVQAKFSTGTGYFPSNKGSFEVDTYKDYVAAYPQFEVSVNQVNETSPDLMGITIGPSWDFYMEIQNQISTMLDSGASVDDTVNSMASALNGLLEQYNNSNS